MDEAIASADANRRFSSLLRGAREGRTYVVTSHGKPVVRLVPADQGEGSGGAALSTLLARLKKQRPVQAGQWARDQLYART